MLYKSNKNKNTQGIPTLFCNDEISNIGFAYLYLITLYDSKL